MGLRIQTSSYWLRLKERYKVKEMCPGRSNECDLIIVIQGT